MRPYEFLSSEQLAIYIETRHLLIYNGQRL